MKASTCMTRTWQASLATAVGLLWFSSASAVPCTVSSGTQTRTATLEESVACVTQNDTNLNDAGDLNALFPDTLIADQNWLKEGELTAAGSNDLFTVTADSWGTHVTGDWFIAESFWSMYSYAVITMHVGHGGGDPDAFAWLIAPGETSGYFSYDVVSGRGGGLSNLMLFGAGPGLNVPAPDALALFGLGLLGITFRRRRARQ
jgi:hypothetical protein